MYLYYVVYRGRRPGVYGTWSECKEQVHEFPGALYEGFTVVQNSKESLCSYQGTVGACSVSTKAVSNTFDRLTNMDVNRVNTLIRPIMILLCIMCLMWVVTIILALLV